MSDLSCSGGSVGCPSGQVRFRIYLLNPTRGPDWVLVGSECLGPQQGTQAVTDFAVAARNYFRQMPLGAPRPTFQPASGAVVNIPAVFAANDGQVITQTFHLGGLSVTVQARPTTWVWYFDPNAVLETSQPGGRYPDVAVTHTYATAGTRLVGVVTFWTGRYSVNGGPYRPVPGVVRRSGTVRVPVLAAPPVLVSR